jgi:hypothetical protein
MLIRVDSDYAREAIANRMNEYAKDTIEYKRLNKLYHGVRAPGSMMCEIQITHEEALLIFRTKDELKEMEIYDL